MKIDSISVVPYRLALHGELKWGKHSSLITAEHCLVRVRLIDGTVGTAEAPPELGGTFVGKPADMTDAAAVCEAG